MASARGSGGICSHGSGTGSEGVDAGYHDEKPVVSDRKNISSALKLVISAPRSEREDTGTRL